MENKIFTMIEALEMQKRDEIEGLLSIVDDYVNSAGNAWYIADKLLKKAETLESIEGRLETLVEITYGTEE